MDLTDLITKLGAFHKKKYNDIVSKALEVNEIRKYFPVMTAVKDEVVITEADVNELAQGYQIQWTPKGVLKLTPEILKLRYFKVDKEIDPNQLRQTWEADRIPGAKAEEYPLVKYFFDKMLKRALLDSNVALIKGTYSAITTGVAGSSNDMVDGLLEYIAQQITATKITPETLGAITKANIGDKIETLMLSIPEEYRERPLKVYMSKLMKRDYFFWYRENFALNTDYKGWSGKIDGTEAEIVGLPYMGASQRIIVTLPDNIILLENKPSEQYNFTIEREKRMINFLMDWAGGIGAKIVGPAGGDTTTQYIWTNELA